MKTIRNEYVLLYLSYVCDWSSNDRVEMFIDKGRNKTTGVNYVATNLRAPCENSRRDELE
jgi:hypothetical protein